MKIIIYFSKPLIFFNLLFVEAYLILTQNLFLQVGIKKLMHISEKNLIFYHSTKNI